MKKFLIAFLLFVPSVVNAAQYEIVSFAWSQKAVYARVTELQPTGECVPAEVGCKIYLVEVKDGEVKQFLDEMSHYDYSGKVDMNGWILNWLIASGKLP